MHFKYSGREGKAGRYAAGTSGGPDGRAPLPAANCAPTPARPDESPAPGGLTDYAPTSGGPGYPLLFSRAALIKPRKSGCGFIGLDLNSGWN